MKNVFQIKIQNGVRTLVPFCEESAKMLDDFKPNQIVTTGKVSGTTKVRSLKENNLYFKACAVFRELMMPDQRWEFTSVDIWFRNYIQYYDHKKTIVLPNGQVIFQVLPLNFAGCKEAQANDYYNKAFQAMADFVGVEKDVFLNEVKSRMKTR